MAIIPMQIQRQLRIVMHQSHQLPNVQDHVWSCIISLNFQTYETGVKMVKGTEMDGLLWLKTR